MARPKKEIRETSFVSIRSKQRAKGRRVLYLDMYRDGKRSYEFLKLYLVAEKDEAAKILNANTMQEAMAIRNQRENEIMSNGGVLKSRTKQKLLLCKWMEIYAQIKEKNGQSNRRALSVATVRQHLIDFAGDKTRLADIDKAFCKRFIAYLAGLTNKKSTVAHRPLTAVSAKAYFHVFTSALNRAVQEEYILSNPVSLLTDDDKQPLKAEQSTRTYLEIDELRKMIATDFRNDKLKRAFLFACFTGLRISDINNLTWENITTKNGQPYISTTIQKTQRHFETKICNEALRWMPDRGKANAKDHIFHVPHDRSTLGRQLREWAKEAGITKDICFHMSRHTFATMELTLGADLFTVSKLLGHKNISITQVYADIIDKKKEDAVDLTNGLFD